jgi:magnesium-protoporphyrin O-methyltransferase
MIAHLSSLAESRLILSFAPKTFAYSLLKKIGEFFPGPSKATRAYLHREADIVKILNDAGWTVKRNAMTKTRFYFSRLLEVTR